MKAEEFELSLDGGVTLHAYRWEPEDGAKAVIQIVHGMAEYAARYARFAEAATANGYAVAAVDLRGHGKSAASPDDWGFFAERDGWNKVVGDLAAQRKRITIEYPDLPVFLLGHSIGSFLAQQLMIEHGGEYAGVILSASNGPVGPLGAVGAFIARLEVLRLGPKGISGLLGAQCRSAPSTNLTNRPGPISTGCRVTRRRSTSTSLSRSAALISAPVHGAT